MPRLHLTNRSPSILPFFVALSLTGCSDEATIETPTSATTTIAAASISETYADTLVVGASGFYSFSVNEYGTVNVTLESIGGTFVPSTVMIGIGIGTPSGTECVTTTTLNTASGTGPHLSGTYQPGVYCAKVWDIGNLFGPATFRIVVAHS
jgi:hypothetical protein